MRLDAVCRALVASCSSEDIAMMIAEHRGVVDASSDPDEIGTSRAMADVLEILATGGDPAEYLIAKDRECNEAEDWGAKEAVLEAQRWLNSDG